MNRAARTTSPGSDPAMMRIATLTILVSFGLRWSTGLFWPLSFGLEFFSNVAEFIKT
jgi:hypothetical protein